MTENSSQNELNNSATEETNLLNSDENESKMKLSIYNLFNNVSNNELIPYPFKFIFHIIETLQILSIAFSAQSLYLWKNENVSESLGSFLGYFLVVDPLLSLNYNGFLILFYIFISIIVIAHIILFIIMMMSMNVNKRGLETSHILFVIFRFYFELLQITFLPFVKTFLTIIDCSQNAKGIVVNRNYEEIECFSGNNIVHVFISIIFLIVFVVSTFIFTRFILDFRSKSSSWGSKYATEQEILFLVQKLLLAIIFVFFHQKSIIILLILFYLGSGLFLYNLTRQNIYYYNQYLYKIVCCQHFFTFWTGTIVLIGYILDHTMFKGQLFLWFVGLAIISIIHLGSDDYRLNLLLINSAKFDSEKQTFIYFHYLNYLIGQSLKNPKIAFLFDCLVEHHKGYCVKEDCPARKKYTKTKNLAKIFKEDNEDENLIMILYLIETLYVTAIGKFHNSFIIKFNYSLFIFEKLGLKQQALQNIFLLETTKLSIEQAYCLYRLKKIIEDELMNVHHGVNSNSNYDYVDELAFQNLEKRLKLNIEKSSGLHLEFWSLLSEDNPDLRRLCEIASKISYLNNYIDNDWQKFSRLNVASACRLMSKFLYYIIQDPEEATAIMDRLRISNLQANKAQIMESQLSEISNDSNSHIIVSAQETNFSQITNCNLAAASNLGYTKNEIINCKINMLIPNIYAKHHDKFVENFVNNLDSKSNISERLLMAKNKMNYLFPIFLTVKHLPSISNNLQFIASFRREKTYRHYAYAIIDNVEGVVLNISSGCVAILGIDEKKISRNELKINDIIPSFFENVKQILTKSGLVVEVYTFFQENIVETENMIVSGSEISFKGAGHQGYMIRFERPRVFKGIMNSYMDQNNSMVKSSLRESNRPSDINENQQIQLISDRNNLLNVDQKPSQLNYFTLKFDITTGAYMGEIIETQNKYYDFMLTDRSKIQLESNRNYQISSRMDENILITGDDQEMAVSEENRQGIENYNDLLTYKLTVSKRSNPQANESKLLKKIEMKLKEDELKNTVGLEEEKGEKIDYGQGIRTIQLFGNRQYDLDDLRKEMERSSDEDSENNEINEEKKDEKGNIIVSKIVNQEEENEDDDLDDNSSLFKNRTKFKTLINNCNMKKYMPLLKMNISAIILLVFIIIIGIVFEVIQLKGLSNIENSYKLIDASSQRIFQIQIINNRIQELVLINKEILKDMPSNYEEIVRKQLSRAVISLSNAYNYIVFNSFGFSARHTALMYNKGTRVFFKDQFGKIFYEDFDINDATNQIVSKAYGISQTPLNKINETNPDLFFISYNLLNGCYQASKNSLTLFVDDLVIMINDSIGLLAIALVCSVLTIFFSLIALNYFYIKVAQYENEILSIFLEIPIPKAKTLFLKCEAFLTQLQQGNEDDDLLDSENLSENDSENNENLLDSSSKKNKKRKKIKVSYVGFKGFLIKLLFFSAIVEGFFILKFFMYKQIFDNQLSIQSEVNSTLYANGVAGVIVNSVRQALLDPTQKIEDKTPDETIPIQIEQINYIFSMLKKEHSINLNILTSEYLNTFNKLMLENGCNYIDLSVVTPNVPCEKIALGALNQGLELTITYFIDSIEKTFFAYQYLQKNLTANLTDLKKFDINITNVISYGNDSQINKRYNVINSISMKESTDLFNSYFTTLIEILAKSFIVGIENFVAAQRSLFIIILIIFIIFNVMLFIVFYFKLIVYLGEKVEIF